MSDSYSNLLYADPSFLEGAASVLDLGDMLSEYNFAGSAELADELALWSDWRATGRDLWRALKQIQGELASCPSTPRREPAHAAHRQ